MEPYTNEGLSRIEKEESVDARKRRLYELVGIVVHSGQASAGHYYSFIKQKRYTHATVCAGNITFVWHYPPNLYSVFPFYIQASVAQVVIVLSGKGLSILGENW